jgi:hypothetical protein
MLWPYHLVVSSTFCRLEPKQRRTLCEDAALQPSISTTHTRSIRQCLCYFACILFPLSRAIPSGPFATTSTVRSWLRNNVPQATSQCEGNKMPCCHLVCATILFSIFTNDHVSICSCLSGAEAEEEAVGWMTIEISLYGVSYALTYLEQICDAWGLHRECENDAYRTSFMDHDSCQSVGSTSRG